MDDADLALLDDALARYALPIGLGSGGFGTITAGDAGGIFGGLLEHIGDTLLPRRLVFRTADCVMVEVLAANRRLLRVLYADPEIDDDPPLSSHAGSPPDAYQIALVFGRLADSGKPITVQSCRIDGTHDPSEVGIPASLIASHLARTPVDAATQIERFLTAAETAPIALVQLEASQIVVAEGDDGTLSDLLDLWRMIWGYAEPSDTPVDPAESAQFVILAAEADDNAGLCTVLIRAGSLSCLMQFDSCAAFDLAARWRATGKADPTLGVRS